MTGDIEMTKPLTLEDLEVLMTLATKTKEKILYNDPEKGYIYIARLFPNSRTYKIGFTSRKPGIRLYELKTAATPDMTVIYSWSGRREKMEQVERLIHHDFHSFINPKTDIRPLSREVYEGDVEMMRRFIDELIEALHAR